MSTAWKALSGIDVGNKIEKKGRFSYLSWSWAWQQVKDKYPGATFEILEDVVFPDGTREVRVSVTIEGLTHMMWLPVMDHSNKAIQNPNARQINDARMRCWVKAIALHGLGLYIYAGEDVPHNDDQQNPPPPPQRQSPMPQHLAVGDGMQSYLDERLAELKTITVLEHLKQWEDYYDSGLNRMNEDRPDLYAILEQEFNKRKAML